MSCISFNTTCPSSGDEEADLLGKILQILNGGGAMGVTAITVNGGVPQTGGVALTIPAALLNFTDDNANADAVVHYDAGTQESFRALGGASAGNLQFAGATKRLHTTAETDQFTFLASIAKGTGAFLEVYGQTHPTGLGGATISIHDNGEFRVRSAPNGSTSSVIRFSVKGDTGLATFLGDIAFTAAAGTKLGTTTAQKLSLWNATPDVQPTTAITAAAFVTNTSGILNDSATFGGYTVGQVVAALKRLGALA